MLHRDGERSLHLQPPEHCQKGYTYIQQDYTYIWGGYSYMIILSTAWEQTPLDDSDILFMLYSQRRVADPPVDLGGRVIDPQKPFE